MLKMSLYATSILYYCVFKLNEGYSTGTLSPEVFVETAHQQFNPPGPQKTGVQTPHT